MRVPFILGLWATLSLQSFAKSTSITTYAFSSKEVSTPLAFKCSGSISATFKKRFKLVQVQIIHRHGDRTPITPMAEKDYWHGTLPSPALLSKLAEGTTINRSGSDGSKVAHAAGGIGPFGKLTKLGMLQMVEVGMRIRDELHLDEEEGTNLVDEEGNLHINSGRLFTMIDPVHPSKVKIMSTDFPRTIQSVQALLMGLFPLGYDGEIEIDAMHTDILIPDPQPRLSQEQAELERELSQRQHLIEREEELRMLSDKITSELHDLIDWENASSGNWGIGEEGNGKKEKSLTFSQLSEVMTCLRVRDKLPETISNEDYTIISSHSAWKWFENLRNENLAKLAMKPFMNFIMEALRDGRNDESDDPVLYIYSCHDSSLIGLMCAFRLEQPAEWPEYGSFLKVELFKSEENPEEDDEGGETKIDYYVRFSLNGEVLKSSWTETGVEPSGMICLKQLSSTIAREHGHECILKES
jgi:acid phosphatase